MCQEFDVIAPLAETAAEGADPSHVGPAISRTPWKRYLADFVLPSGTLVSMAVFTVVVIVVVVTTVAETRLHVQGDRSNVWARWASSPACSVWDHRSAYASLAPSTGTTQAHGGTTSIPAPDEINSRQIALWLPDE